MYTCSYVHKLNCCATSICISIIDTMTMVVLATDVHGNWYGDCGGDYGFSGINGGNKIGE